MTGAVERVVVVGRDAAAWLTGLALHRAFSRTGVSVCVVELPSLLGPADVYSTTPSLAGLHRLLGVPEREVLRVCRGLPVAGQRFTGWSGNGSAFLHGYDAKRAAINGIDFLQFWIKARAEGLKAPLEEFSMAAAAASRGRLSPQDTDPDAFGNVMPGYHLHARAYSGAMRRLAIDIGVSHHADELDVIDRDGDRIRSVTLAGGEQIRGDLFIDASGAEGVLIDGQPRSRFESWAEWLPCDRILSASGPALSPFPAHSEITAFPAGWFGLFPLQNRTAVTAAYSSADTSEREVLDAIVRLTGIPLQGEPVVRPFTSGARSPWIGNCVAVGAAAGALEPLDAIGLHVVHIAISNLVSLFPVDSHAMPEARSYNDTIRRNLDNLRDFQIAHYRLNRRFGEPLWDRVRDAAGPVGLDSKLALFASRGKVPIYDEESFEEQNWAAIFIGHGLVPRTCDPLVDRVPVDERTEKIERLGGLVASGVASMPTVSAYLAAEDRPHRGGTS